MRRNGTAGVRDVAGTLYRFKTEGDSQSGAVKLYPATEKGERQPGAAPAGTLRLSRSADGGARLQGDFGGYAVAATLEREEAGSFPLTSRGFRWISEEPYFR